MIQHSGRTLNEINFFKSFETRWDYDINDRDDLQMKECQNFR